MAEYKYNGCVTGFSESDTVSLWQPILLPYTVERDDNEYSQRLLDVLLLETTLPADMGLAQDYSGTGWYKATDTGIVYCKDVPEGETHVFDGDPTEYYSAPNYSVDEAADKAAHLQEVGLERLATSNMTSMVLLGAIFDTSYAEYSGQDLSHYDTSNVVDMRNMFGGGLSVSEIKGIENWNTAKVEKMDFMFNQAIYMNQDLSMLCVPKITKEPNGFDDSLGDWTKPKPVWGTCPRGEDAS